MDKPHDISHEQLAAVPVGTVLWERVEVPVRFQIVRGRNALCVYMGVPSGHPLAGFEQDGIPIQCHGGGFNFAREGGTEREDTRALGMVRPSGWYWYGYSYNERNDLEIGADPDPDLPERRGHSLREARGDQCAAGYDFMKLVCLAEEIAMRALGWRTARKDKGRG